IVGSRLGNDGDDAAASPAEFGVIAVALDLEFLNGVQRGVYKNGAVRSHVHVVGAIHQEQVGIRGAAADGDVGAAIEALLVVAEAGINLYARNQREQLGEAPAIERQFGDLIAFNGTAQFSTGQLNMVGRGLHFDRLSGGPDRQFGVEREVVVDMENDVFFFKGLEALSAGHSYIVATVST